MKQKEIVKGLRWAVKEGLLAEIKTPTGKQYVNREQITLKCSYCNVCRKQKNGEKNER
jgi:hypothetical protein